MNALCSLFYLGVGGVSSWQSLQPRNWKSYFMHHHLPGNAGQCCSLESDHPCCRSHPLHSWEGWRFVSWEEPNSAGWNHCQLPCWWLVLLWVHKAARQPGQGAGGTADLPWTGFPSQHAITIPTGGYGHARLVLLANGSLTSIPGKVFSEKTKGLCFFRRVPYKPASSGGDFIGWNT